MTGPAGKRFASPLFCGARRCVCPSDCGLCDGCGARRIRQELIRRGIAQEYVEEALEQLESDPRERIAQLILRKYPDLYEGERQRARAFNGLMRLGYGFEDIRYVAGHLEEFIEQEE